MTTQDDPRIIGLNNELEIWFKTSNGSLMQAIV